MVVGAHKVFGADHQHLLIAVPRRHDLRAVEMVAVDFFLHHKVRVFFFDDCSSQTLCALHAIEESKLVASSCVLKPIVCPAYAEIRVFKCLVIRIELWLAHTLVR
jgi:hypothetical protein